MNQTPTTNLTPEIKHVNVQGTPINSGARSISFKPKTLAKVQLAVIMLLVICHLIAFFTQYVSGLGPVISYYLQRFFNLDYEANIPTLYSSINLLISSVLLLCIYITDKGIRRKSIYWLFLSIIFFYLFLDEAVQIHDSIFNRLFAKMKHHSTFFGSAWVIPYAAIVLALGIFFLRFVLSLPPATRKLFIISGITFVSGALGCEFLQGHFATAGYNPQLASNVINALRVVEEVLEMVGITIFIYSLLKYLTPSNGKVQISFS